ncbi:MAG: arginine--tRNA ligase [Candidatus Taylorbacteria bacterium]|nr:arginine--tRNA ligase [Candidatus Taylorbacteria bacterium]
MNIVETLEKAIQKALAELNIDVQEVTIEHPKDIYQGDYSTNVAMVYGKQLKTNPKELALKIKTLLEKAKIIGVEKIEIAGAGFINFYLTQDFFTKSIENIVRGREKFGSNDEMEGKKVLVEYSSPNIAKPFTIGHLRSTIIGDSIANILEFLGYKVIRDNHLGDWGTQFGKQIVAIKHWSNLDSIRNSENQMKALVELYVKFHEEAEKDKGLEDEAREWFLKLEQGDEEAREIYEITVDISMKYFNMIYSRLGVHPFDTLHGEAFYEPLLKEVLLDIEKAGIAKESEGARLIFFKDDKYPPLMIQKKDGATLYATRDLATDKWRGREYGKDTLVINETGAEQSMYFKQLFEVDEMLGYFEKKNRVFVGHGFIRSKDGKMSTRKGNVIWLEEVLDEAIVRAKAINENTAEMVGIGAIKFNDLKRESSQDIIFNWDEILNLKGDSGPYLQYSCVRAHSIVAKSKDLGSKHPSDLDVQRLSEISDLERLLYRFPEVVTRAGNEYSPHYIATYLIEIASAFNNYYAHNKIIDETDLTSPYKVALTEAFAIVMSNGLKLLGIQVPEKM